MASLIDKDYPSFSSLRSEELKYLISAITENSSTQRIIYIQGQPGIGKSTLTSELIDRKIQEYNEILSSVYEAKNYICFARLDFKNVSPDRSNEFQIISQLYQQILDWPLGNMVFPRYELARTYLYKLSNETKIEYRVKSNSKIFQSIPFIVEKGISCIADMILTPSVKLSTIPIQILLAQLFNQLAGDKGENIRHLFNYIFPEKDLTLQKFSEKFKHDFDARNESECVANLTKYFIQDLEYNKKNCTAHKVIFLDTFEKVSPVNQHWLYRELLHTEADILWVIAGTDPYAFDFIDKKIRASLLFCPWDTTKTKHIWELRLLSDNSSRDLLRARGVPDGEVQEYMAFLAHGLPAALSLLADSYTNIKDNGHEPTINDFVEDDIIIDNLYAKLLETTYLKHISVEKKRAYGFLAELDEWDKPIFDIFAKKINLPLYNELFNNLIGESIVTQNRIGRWSFLEVPKMVFQKSSSKVEKEQNYEIAYQIYCEQCEQKLKTLSSHNEWCSEEYLQFEAMCMDALHYGILQYKDITSFNMFSSWFICGNGISEGFEQKLSKYKLYSLKRKLLQSYLQGVEEKDGFGYDYQKKFQLQAYYDLSWAYIFLHQYDMAIGQLSLQMSIGLPFWESLQNEEYIKRLYSFGVIYQRWGKYEESKIWHQLAACQRELIYKKNPNNYAAKMRMAFSENAYADVLMNLGEFEEAQKAYQSALSLHGITSGKEGILQASGEKPSNAVSVIGNYSKLFYLWGTAKCNAAHLKEAKRYIQACMEFCKDQNGNIDYPRESEMQVRMLTINFQLQRLKDINAIPHTEDYQEFVKCYQVFIRNWETRPNGPLDYAHNILNTMHNLSIAYAYAGNREKAIETIIDCIQKRSAYQSPVVNTLEKNLNTALENEKLLESDHFNDTDFWKLKTIY